MVKRNPSEGEMTSESTRPSIGETICPMHSPFVTYVPVCFSVRNTPDVSALQNDLSAANSARLQAEINQAATLEAIKQGIDVKSIPYLLKMADFKDCIDEKGGIKAENLTNAIKTVLDDIPALKVNQKSTDGVQKIGGDGVQSSAGSTAKSGSVPTKKWNKFNI